MPKKRNPQSWKPLTPETRLTDYKPWQTSNTKEVLDSFIQENKWRNYVGSTQFLNTVKDFTTGSSLVHLHGNQYSPLRIYQDTSGYLEQTTRVIADTFVRDDGKPSKSSVSQVVRESRFREVDPTGTNSKKIHDKLQALSPENLVQNDKLLRASFLEKESKRQILEQDPFIFWINPSEMSVERSSMDSELIVKERHDRHAWGLERGRISCSGKTPGCYIPKNFAERGPSGLTRADRSLTESYNHLQELLARFLSNGVVYSQNTDEIVRVGHLILTYNDFAYYGTFKSLEMSETAESPYILDYSFVFEYTSRTKYLDFQKGA